MICKRVLKNGRWQYRVHWLNPAKTTGNGYSMSFFPTRQAADDFMAGLEADRARFGSQWQEIGTMDRVEAVAALQAARAAGVSLREAVNQAAARRGAPEPSTVSEILDACLESKRMQGIRPRSLRSLTATFRRFSREHGRQQASSVTPGVIERFLSGLNVAPRSRLGHLINLQTGFSHAVRNGTLERNPCAAVPRPVVEKGETSILTPEQTGKLFAACEVEDPELLGFLALSAFAGFRPESEVERMGREDVEAGLRSGFLAPPSMNKTRRRRLVPVVDNLLEWLTVWLPLGAPVIPVNFQRRWRRVRRASGIDPWPQNVLRHSRVSYRLAVTGDAAKTADEDGHSQEQLHRTYKALVTPEEGARYFSIRPTPGADYRAAAAAAKARQESKSRGGPERMIQMSKARWSKDPAAVASPPEPASPPERHSTVSGSKYR